MKKIEHHRRGLFVSTEVAYSRNGLCIHVTPKFGVSLRARGRALQRSVVCNHGGCPGDEALQHDHQDSGETHVEKD